MKKIIFFFYLCIAFTYSHAECDQNTKCELKESTLSELDLDTAIYRALTQSLNLHIANNNAQSKYYQVKQAQLYPNPVFNYELENVAGNNNWKGWNNREERYIWSQLFETGGKRQLRTQAAAYQYYASLVGYDVSKLIVLNRLNRAFISVVAAQELLAITIDQTTIAQEVLQIATKKVEAGKVSLIQQNKAEVAYSATLIALDNAKMELKNAKRRLSLLWSETCPNFEKVVFPFFDINAPLSFDQSLANLCNQAEVIQSFYDYLNAKKTWYLEKANRIPDVTLQVGYKANYEERNQGLIAGVSIPIPIFNRNQGNVGRAYQDMLKTGEQRQQLWLFLESKLAISYEELMQAYKKVERIQNTLLPSATKAFELAQIGYREGKFEYLDILDAQRTLFDVRGNYIQALVTYHTRQADISYLNSQVD